MKNRPRLLAIASIAAVIALILLPLLADKFTVQFATRVLIMALFAMSLNLLVGQAGLVSLGHAAFFGAAGYCLALVSPPSSGAALWMTLPLAMMVAGGLALVIGMLVLRTSGVYFIMATLAFAQMLYFLLHDTTIAGGSDGMYINVRPDAILFGWRPFDLEKFGDFYWLVLALFLVVSAFIWLMRASLFGRVIAGIRVNEARMRSLGFATLRYKLACFVIAGMLAGLAGYLGAAQFGVVNPDMLGWQFSGAVLMMVILGGRDTVLGPALGAAALLLLEMGLQSLPVVNNINLGKHWQLPLGAIIVLVALYVPDGVLRLLRRSDADE